MGERATGERIDKKNGFKGWFDDQRNGVDLWGRKHLAIQNWIGGGFLSYGFPPIPGSSKPKESEGGNYSSMCSWSKQHSKKNLTPSLWPRLDLLHGF
jgi:hypothetical protein